MPPFVVWSSIGVPPPFSVPSKWRRDFSETSRFSTEETLMPPLVHDADRLALAFSGTINVTPPLVVRAEIGSVPIDARSRVTPPLVDRASTPPVRFLPLTPPLVV